MSKRKQKQAKVETKVSKKIKKVGVSGEAKEIKGGRDLDEIDVRSDDFLSNLFGEHLESFRASFTDKYPLVVHGNPSRVNGIKKLLYDLDVNKYCENTSSERIHVWFPPNEDGSMKSIQIDDPEEATRQYENGLSLYCRAPGFLEKRIIPKLLRELGLGPNDAGNDRFGRGEIETFFSRKGHTTSQHTDFQENITIQLTGTKEWAFNSSPVAYPTRGCTPHFNERSGRDVAEAQLKSFKLANEDWGASVSATRATGGESSIVLKPGDILYHPAGVWHEVKCTEDSIAINISLMASSRAEVFCSALQQVLMMDHAWREPMSIGSRTGLLPSSLIHDASRLCGTFQESMFDHAFISPDLHTSRGNGGDSDSDDEEEEEEEDGGDDEDEEEEEEGEGNGDDFYDDEDEDEEDEDEGVELCLDSTDVIVPDDFKVAAVYRINPIVTTVTSVELLSVGCRARFAPLWPDMGDSSEEEEEEEPCLIPIQKEKDVRDSKNKNGNKAGESEIEIEIEMEADKDLDMTGSSEGFAVVFHSGYGNDTLESICRRVIFIPWALKDAWDSLDLAMKSSSSVSQNRYASLLAEKNVLTTTSNHDIRLIYILVKLGALLEN